MQVPLLNTKLEDRTLWYDGDYSVSANALIDMISGQGHIYVDKMTDEISNYNLLVDEDEMIRVKNEVRPFDLSWNIPDEYKELDIRHHVLILFERELERLGLIAGISKAASIRAKRILKELDLFEKYQLFDVVRTLIFIINRFESEDIVWGVGRGSSVSSYILYLIGVHDIDSVEFNLDVKEFLHTS